MVGERLCNAAQPSLGIRVSAIVPLLRVLDTLGPAGDVLLAEHRLNRALPREPAALFPIEAYLALFECTAALAGDPCLGARLGLEMRAADLGPAGLAFSASSTIRLAFERLSRPMSALQGATSTHFSAEGPDRLVWSYAIADRTTGPRRQDAEFTLATNCQMVRQSFDPRWRPLEVHFEHPAPRVRAALEAVFEAPLRFGQPSNRIVLDRGTAEIVHRADDEAVLLLLDRHLAGLGTDAGGAGGMRRKADRIVGLLLGRSPVTIAVVAREIGCSERTLQRRLAEEGTSLRALVRNHRQERAALYLAHGGVRRAALAEKLGYADSTVLWRAARSWRDGEGAAVPAADQGFMSTERDG